MDGLDQRGHPRRSLWSAVYAELVRRLDKIATQ